MSNNITRFMKKSIWITIIVFCIRCLVLGDSSISNLTLYDIYSYAGESVVIVVIIMIIYNKVLWKYDPFEPTPSLKKMYSGYFISNSDKVRREATLEIKQTLLSTKIIFKSGESKSRSISASIENVLDEWQLTYCYLNEPQANVRERSAIHYGTAMLCIEDKNNIEGQYYTDRNTTGDMYFFSNVKKK